ncbi:hypothetical protein ACOZ4I_17380 (plasmid) [Haloarcula salina]|uniref:hypothetical protein n=1 Tax=Haloarcula salina TaxID=1429914 RepID=UPI003C6FD83B
MSNAETQPRVIEPDLAPEEKETIFRFDKVDDRATVFSEQRGAVSRLLRHPEADADEIMLADGSSVDDVDVLDGDDTVIGYRGTVPIGALKVLKKTRDSTRPSEVISAGWKQ